MDEDEWEPRCPKGHPATVVTGPDFVAGRDHPSWQQSVVRRDPDRWQALVRCEECGSDFTVEAPAQW
jgi:hypothetical protein